MESEDDPLIERKHKGFRFVAWDDPEKDQADYKVYNGEGDVVVESQCPGYKIWTVGAHFPDWADRKIRKSKP